MAYVCWAGRFARSWSRAPCGSGARSGGSTHGICAVRGGAGVARGACPRGGVDGGGGVRRIRGGR
eukprot:11220110-Lingulodinium_polyedra.AAC.1